MKEKYIAGDKCQICLSKEMAAQLNLLEELGFTPDTCKITSFVFESKEYDLLTKLLGNRTITLKNVDNKKELLEKNGFKSTNPVIVNTDGQIIDGQHRRLASEQLGIEYKFTIDVSTDVKDSLQTTIELNNSGKPWTTTDYINAFAENGNEEYKKLIKLLEELDLGYNRGLILYHSNIMNRDTRNGIKEGHFRYDENKAELARQRKKEVNALVELVNPRYKKLIMSEPFCKAYLELTKKENFKYKILKDQFEKMRYTDLDRRNLSESLVNVYNIQRRINRIKL